MKVSRYAVVLGLLLAATACGPTSYVSCDEAKKANATPLHRGESGWNDRLDRDGDGVACE